jgi:enoyl-CoA hydratase
MIDPVLIVERSDEVATLTLNRPRAMNALSRELREAIAKAFTELTGDRETRVVIVTGAGRAFCAGLDLKELSSSGTDAGFELALACDVLVASSEARFADTHARVGILPGWGLSQKLPRLIGIHRAKELSLTGNYLSAEQAEAWGLVNRVVPPADLLPTCRALASDMLSCVPEALRGYKRVIDAGFATTFSEGLALEGRASRDHAKSVTPDALAQRRGNVQERGRSQTRS